MHFAKLRLQAIAWILPSLLLVPINLISGGEPAEEDDGPDHNVTLHLKDDVKADLPATARAVTDEAERRELLSAIKNASRFDQRRTMDVEAWARGSCLVELTLSG